MVVKTRQIIDTDRPMYDTTESSLDSICIKRATCFSVQLSMFLFTFTPLTSTRTAKLVRWVLEHWTVDWSPLTVCSHILHWPTTVDKAEKNKGKVKRPSVFWNDCNCQDHLESPKRHTGKCFPPQRLSETFDDENVLNYVAIVLTKGTVGNWKSTYFNSSFSGTCI